MKYKLFLLISLVYGCSWGQPKYEIRFLIPQNYTGWVNIIFEDSAATNSPFAFSNGCVYVISKNPAEYKVRGSEFPVGEYKMEFYYYSTDTLVRLKSWEYPYNNIFFSNFREFRSSVRSRTIRDIRFYSFFVSKDSLRTDSLSIDRLPKNPVFD